ncbi:MAG: nucleotidyltransferase family protein [Bacteroidales bacterium]
MFVPEAIILAGGGKNYTASDGTTPLCMTPVCNKPFLAWLLEFMEHYIIEHAVIAVGKEEYNLIHGYFGENYKSIKISYSVEETPLGTGGAIQRAFELIEGDKAFVFKGHTMLRLSLVKHFDFHMAYRADFSMVIRETGNLARQVAVERDEDKRITTIYPKGTKSGKGYMDGGAYLISRRFFTKYSFPEKFSLERDILHALAGKGAVYGVLCKQFFVDISDPEDRQRAEDEFERFNH